MILIVKTVVCQAVVLLGLLLSLSTSVSAGEGHSDDHDPVCAETAQTWELEVVEIIEIDIEPEQSAEQADHHHHAHHCGPCHLHVDPMNSDGFRFCRASATFPDRKSAASDSTEPNGLFRPPRT